MFKFTENPFEGNDDSLQSPFYRNLIKKEEAKDANVDDQSQVDDQGTYTAEHSEPQPSKEDDPFLDDEKRAYNILTNGTSKAGFSKEVDKILALREVDKIQTANQVAETFGQLFKDLNDQYGLEVQFDFNSFTKTLSYIIQPKNQKAIEVYISEAYSRTRAVLYMMYLNAIGQLSQQILDPKFITSNSMSYQDKLILMRELFSYIQSLDEIYERVKVDQADIKLRKLAEEGDEDVNELRTPEVQDFLKSLVNSIKEDKK